MQIIKAVQHSAQLRLVSQIADQRGYCLTILEFAGSDAHTCQAIGP